MAEQIRRIVRFMETDIDGSLPIIRALRRIKGASFMFSNAACLSTATDPKRKIGSLSDTELKTLESAIKKPPFPGWMLNRRKDLETGLDIHLTGSALAFRKREDINFLRKIRAYRGIRHELGQPTRGQRTRSTFRTQKAVGVSKKGARQAKPKAEKK